MTGTDRQTRTHSTGVIYLRLGTGGVEGKNLPSTIPHLSRDQTLCPLDRGSQPETDLSDVSGPVPRKEGTRR